MKKLYIALSILFLTGWLGACGGTDVEEKDIGSVETEDNTGTADEEAQETDENTDEGEVREYNQEIVDNENIKATLISVEKIIDKTWDEEKIEVKFEVENKREDTIEVQAREVSADGKMIDDSMLVMSQEVSGGKRADAILTIQNYDGDLPVIENNLEMILHIFSWDDMDLEEDHNVIIDFK